MSSKFTHIGMNNVVQNDRVIAVIPPSTATAKRYKENSKMLGKFISAELGRAIKSMIIMDDGTVITSCIRPRTLLGRFNGAEVSSDDPEEEDGPDEDN